MRRRAQGEDVMSKTRRWLALALALAIAFGALAPATALATRGGNPLDTMDDPQPPMEYGDPEPNGGGSPMQTVYSDVWLQILLASMRMRIALPIVPVRATRTAATRSTSITVRGKSK